MAAAKKQTLSFNHSTHTMDLSRHVAGKATFAQLLDSWIEISGISSFEWSLLATDALGVSKLQPSQIGALRKGVTSHLGVMVLDAIAAVNAAAWKYHRENKSILKGIHAHKISQIPPLECDCQAADAADFLLIYLGLQEAPPLPENWLGVKREESIEPQSDNGRLVRIIENFLLQHPLVKEGREVTPQDPLYAKVVARLQRGVKDFSDPDEELLVLKIAFRAWKDMHRGGSPDLIEVAAMRSAGIDLTIPPYKEVA